MARPRRWHAAYHGAMSTGLLGRGARAMASWSPVERDAVLYAASALFAIGTAQLASISLYQQWGRLAVGPYAAGRGGLGRRRPGGPGDARAGRRRRLGRGAGGRRGDGRAARPGTGRRPGR